MLEGCRNRPDLMTSIDTLAECCCIDDVYDGVAMYDVLPVLYTSTICADSVSYTDDTTIKSLMTHRVYDVCRDDDA